MTAHLLLLGIQVISCYSADGILTFEPTAAASAYSVNKETSPHWQTILKSAMFRTISKYTGFSPSLDVKMEADGLLWEKINGAKYTRKILKPGEEEDRLKTGVLIDLSRENGHLEFRQVDRSLYRSVPQDHRLLALWRMRKVEPNHFLIQIKIPEERPPEYLYEYDLENGLQEINIKDWDYNKNKQNKNGTWKTGDRKVYSASSEVYEDRNKQPKSLSYAGSKRQYNGNTYEAHEQTYTYQKVTPARTYLYKPAAQYFTLVSYQTPPPPPPPPPPAPKYTTWLQQGDYYTNPPTTSLPEFKQDSSYNGFLPSLGPTGSPPLYEESVNGPIMYKQTVTYFPPYVPEVHTTQKPYPITYFKPSTQFIQYSEVDPYYSSNETYDYGFSTPTEIPTLSENVAQYPQFVFNTPPTSAISVQVPPVAPGISLYDIALNTIKNENRSIESFSSENNPQATVTTLTFDYLQQTESYNDTGPIEQPKPTTEILHSTTGSDFSKTRIKNSLRNSQRITNTGDSYDYAPLYIQWGEKIRPNRKQLRTTTPKSNIYEYNTREYQSEESSERENTEEPNHINTENTEKEDSTETPEIKASTQKQGERLRDHQNQRHQIKIQELNVTDQTENASLENNFEFSLNNGSFENLKNYSNFVGQNITSKSPEEVVRDLTNLGFQNSTDTQTSENLQNENVKQVGKDAKDNDSQLESTEPISVVVNRISQSFSYKTSVGHTGNLKQLPDKT